ncbi:MAG: arsenosugar biosynthesis radical SAM protein ArsS [Gammaproteobacteria bacterium]|nr:arsenosugar biosynthesis radical SAM protein ArsS [Gammaproteobacteria bacterium]
MHDTLPLLGASTFPALARRGLETLQVNIGLRCNLACLHCHTNSNPHRREEMSEETIELVLRFLDRRGPRTLDITGGAPELHPRFHYLVEQAASRGVHVMDRCNLTVLELPGFADLHEFLAAQRVEVVASLPCYTRENVDAQRGRGVFDASLAALRKLNGVGYGVPGSGLELNLVYNPLGPYLPPAQAQLEADYKRELGEKYGIVFNRLFTLTNMPIKRFGSTLVSRGQLNDYLALLHRSHRDDNLEKVMCRTLLSVDWAGYVYDCDFNQMLGLAMEAGDSGRTHLSELMGRELEGARINVRNHCYGCTAGQGSSCGGALTT